MRTVIVLAGLGVALLAGCGDAREGGGDEGDPPPLAGPLVYGRFGGSTGSASRIRLQPDGRATFAAEGISDHMVKLRPAELEEVERELARVDLAKLPAKFLPPEPVPDAFGHEVTYQGETVYTGAETDVPDELGALNGTLSGLLAEYAPRPLR